MQAPSSFLYVVEHKRDGIECFEVLRSMPDAEALMDLLESHGFERRLTIYRRVNYESVFVHDDAAKTSNEISHELANDLWAASVAGGIALIVLAVLICLI